MHHCYLAACVFEAFTCLTNIEYIIENLAKSGGIVDIMEIFFISTS